MENPPKEVQENHPLAGQEKALKVDLDETFKKKKKKKRRKGKGQIERTRVAQMMFKTALRNHLDLSSLADNKASTMLSVNTLIITIALPFMVPKIEEYPVLALPAAVLLTTCIISIVFATLVTRPGKMGGVTSEESLQQGKGDLFFFGNFFKILFWKSPWCEIYALAILLYCFYFWDCHCCYFGIIWISFYELIISFFHPTSLNPRRFRLDLKKSFM